MKEECLICQAPLEYLEQDISMECAISEIFSRRASFSRSLAAWFSMTMNSELDSMVLACALTEVLWVPYFPHSPSSLAGLQS